MQTGDDNRQQRRMGYLPSDTPSFQALVSAAENGLHAAVISYSFHVLHPIFPPIIARCSGFRKHAHPFSLPTKDIDNFIPCVLLPYVPPLHLHGLLFLPFSLPVPLFCLSLFSMFFPSLFFFISCDLLFSCHVVESWFVDRPCFSLIKRIYIHRDVWQCAIYIAMPCSVCLSKEEE